MGKREADIRKRIAKRNEQRRNYSYEVDMQDYQYEDIQQDVKQKVKGTIHGYIVKVLFSVALVLAIGVLFRGDASSQMTGFRNFVSSLFNQEFQFTAVRGWVETNFGKSLTFINDTGNKGSNNLAVPATGRVLQGFDVNGQGVMVELNKDQKVEAIKDGTVIFIGDKPNSNNTVIIQHEDNTESWYGNLDEIDVKLYDTVKSKQNIGTAKVDETSGSGKLYFAFKKNEKFIDPIQVIPFE